jgi:hypothetical protein
LETVASVALTKVKREPDPICGAGDTDSAADPLISNSPDPI